MRGPILEAALDAWRVEGGRRNWRGFLGLVGMLVSTPGQQYNKKQQCSHNVEGSPDHWFAGRISPRWKEDLTVAYIRPRLTTWTLDSCPAGSRANDVKGRKAANALTKPSWPDMLSVMFRSVNSVPLHSILAVLYFVFNQGAMLKGAGKGIAGAALGTQLQHS
jgi:hypothetical protein